MAQRINKIEHENVMVPLLSSILAIRHHNRKWHKNYINNSLPWGLGIYSPVLIFSRTQVEILYDNLGKLLRYTKLHSLDHFILIFYFITWHFLDGDILEKFLQENAQPLSLLDVRLHTNSFVDSKIDPILWFDFLYRRSTETS